MILQNSRNLIVKHPKLLLSHYNKSIQQILNHMKFRIHGEYKFGPLFRTWFLLVQLVLGVKG